MKINITAILLSILYFIFLHSACAQVMGWNWLNGIGSSGEDISTSFTTDASNNIYITGYSNSPSLAFGTQSIMNPDGYAMFVAKYDPKGNTVWVRNSVGEFYEGALSIAADASGNVFVGGIFESNSISFDTIILFNHDLSRASSDSYLVKYDSSGNVKWARSSEGTDWDVPVSIANDHEGNNSVRKII